MNIVWTLLLCLSMGMLTIFSPQSVLTMLFSASDRAFQLTLSFTAVYCVWLGFFNVVNNCGAVEKLSKLLKPIMQKIYGKIDETAQEFILLNMSANLLGISNGATPSAVKAIEILEKNSNGEMSFASTMLFVLNATSLQILPTTVLGMRAVANSKSAFDIILPTIISTVFTTVCGIILVFVFKKREKQR